MCSMNGARSGQKRTRKPTRETGLERFSNGGFGVKEVLLVEYRLGNMKLLLVHTCEEKKHLFNMSSLLVTGIFL